MGFYSPTITSSWDEFSSKISETDNAQFVLGPYTLNRLDIINSKQPLSKGTPALMLFNFPDDVTIYLNSTPIPGKIFDYLNPLLVNSKNVSQIEFYSGTNNLNVVQCKCLYSKSANPTIKSALSKNIHYAGGYSIDYRTMQVTRSSDGVQICDIIMKRPSQNQEHHPPNPPNTGILLQAFFSQLPNMEH